VIPRKPLRALVKAAVKAAGGNLPPEMYDKIIDGVIPMGKYLSLDKEWIDAQDPSDPLNQQYKNTIQAAQGGLHDNELKRMRYFTMQQLAADSICIAPARAANVVECGCWHGHSTLILEDTLYQWGTGQLHVFDSFEGLSEFTEKDGSNAHEAEVRAAFRSNFDELAKKINPARTVLHKGWIPQVFHDVDVGRVAFAHIDVDLYEPTRDALWFVYPKLIEGGAMFLDDYGYKSFPGATAAVDEFVQTYRPKRFVRMSVGGAFLIK
jgi:hypothetical protein